MNPMKEVISGAPVKFFGANITGGEGGATPNISCITVNNIHFELAEIDTNGAIVVKNDRFQRLSLEDYGKDGIKILKDNATLMNPGERTTIAVGSVPLSIESTTFDGVTLNGQPATKYNRELELQRYPHLKR